LVKALGSGVMNISRVMHIVVISVLTMLAAMPISHVVAEPGKGKFQVNETYVEQFVSAFCGFEVIAHDVGVLRITTDSDGAEVVIFSLDFILTNPETGGTFTVQQSGRTILSEKQTDENGSFIFKQTFSGLNYRVVTDRGKVVSSGHGGQTLAVTYDAEGNIVDVQFEHPLSPHLEHFTSFLFETGCPLLAAP
jgi:hypothetical protein